MVTESPTLGGLVVMPIVSHRPTFGAIPVGFIVPIPSRTTVMPTIRPLRQDEISSLFHPRRLCHATTQHPAHRFPHRGHHAGFALVLVLRV